MRAAKTSSVLDTESGFAQSFGLCCPQRIAKSTGIVKASTINVIRLEYDQCCQLAATHMIAALPDSMTAQKRVLRNKKCTHRSSAPTVVRSERYACIINISSISRSEERRVGKECRIKGRRHTRWPRDWSSDVCSSDLD